MFKIPILLLCFSLIEPSYCISGSCRYKDSSHAGLDLKRGYGPTYYYECEKDCLAEPLCAGYTLDEIDYCYLHSGIEPGRIRDGTRPGSVLFIKNCHNKQTAESLLYEDSIHEGLDFKPGYKTPAWQCKFDCWLDKACAGSTHDKIDYCYLHYRIDKGRIRKGTRPGATLYIKHRNRIQTDDSCLYKDSTHAGLDIKDIRDKYAYPASFEQCKQDCMALDKCAGCTHDDGKCYLHYLIEERRIQDGKRPGSTLYVKECRKILPRGSCDWVYVGMAGGDLGKVRVDNADDCRLLCMESLVCQASIYEASTQMCKRSTYSSRKRVYNLDSQIFIKFCF